MNLKKIAFKIVTLGGHSQLENALAKYEFSYQQNHQLATAKIEQTNIYCLPNLRMGLCPSMHISKDEHELSYLCK